MIKNIIINVFVGFIGFLTSIAVKLILNRVRSRNFDTSNNRADNLEVDLSEYALSEYDAEQLFEFENGAEIMEWLVAISDPLTAWTDAKTGELIKEKSKTQIAFSENGYPHLYDSESMTWKPLGRDE